MKLSIDIETKSSVDLAKCGVYKYVEAKEFDILLIAYAFDDGDIEVVDLTKNKLPGKLRQAIIDSNVEKYAFNANFERICLSKYLGVNLDIKSFKCSQVMSLRLGLSSSLDGVSNILNLETKKLKEGKSLIKYFNTNAPDSDLNKWEDFKNYCKNDVYVEQNIRKKLDEYNESIDKRLLDKESRTIYNKDTINKYIESKESINKSDVKNIKYNALNFEEKLYILDQKINDRGVYVDKIFIEKVLALNSYNEKILENKLKSLTNIENIKSPIQVKNYLKENHNIEIKSLNKESIKEIIANTDDKKLKQILILRQALTKTSIKKYLAMKNTLTKDNSIKGLFKYYGANKTGRFSGRLVQVQNLPQTNIEDIEFLKAVIKSKETKETYEIIDLFHEDLQSVLSNLIRTSFIPRPNKKYIISDFSAIEARVLAFIANEKWRIDVFNTHSKIYEASAAKMFNIDIDKITKESEFRQKGKVCELALGYQGGVNALKKMGGNNLGISEGEMLNLVRNFRNSNKNIVKFWEIVEKASIYAVKNKCSTKLNNIFCDISFIYDSGYLYINLPSNRKLAYRNASIEIDNNFNKEVLTYESINQTTKKYEKTYTYGGKLTENIVQAIARDILGVKMLDLDELGYDIVMHVHDEVVVEVDESVGIDDINCVMEGEIRWLKGLRLKADTQESYYYKK